MVRLDFYHCHIGSNSFEQKINKLTGKRIWRVVSLSRKVTVEVFTVSKSMVIPNGIAISSVRAYLLPIDPLESSTFTETSFFRSSFTTSATRVNSSGLLLKGSTEHLTGAIRGGKDKY
jgi:hypothetical protein